MAEKPEFVYLRTGEKCRVLHRDEEQLFVSVQIVHEYFYGDEEQIAEEDGPILRIPAVQDNFFDAPPTKVLSEEIVKLEERSAVLRDEVARMQRDTREAKQKSEEKLAEYARRSSVLEKLDQFLLGGITHYFIKPKYSHSKPSILTVEETLSEKHYDKGQGRLLSLRPEKGRGRGSTLTWALSNTGTGSGGDWECVPCTSREEALALGQEWIDEQASEKKYTVTVIGFAREYDLELPERYISELIVKEARNLEETNRAADAKREEVRAKKEAYWKELRGAKAGDGGKR